MTDGIVWADVPGTDGKYQVSTKGDVRSLKKDGTHRILRGIRTGSRQIGVRRVCIYVRKQKIMLTVSRAVYALFIGDIPAGGVIRHKNGMITDDRVENLELVGRKELGKITAKRYGRRKTIRKVDASGDILACYRSMEDAAKQNYVSRRCVYSCMMGQNPNYAAKNGFTFELDEA